MFGCIDKFRAHVRPVQESDRIRSNIWRIESRRFCRPVELIDLLLRTSIKVQDLDGYACGLDDGVDTCLQAKVFNLNCMRFDMGPAVFIDSLILGVIHVVFRVSFHPGTSDQLDPIRPGHDLSRVHRRCLPGNA